MENDVISKDKEYRIYKHEDFSTILGQGKETDASQDSFTEQNSVEINFSANELGSSIEDSSSLLSNTFRQRNVILNEKWDFSENVQGRITSVNEKEVCLDCLIDIDNRTFQHRVFPFNLFKHIKGLQKNKTVIIKTKTKAGSVRIDVFPGDGIVDVKLFNLKDKWDSLSNSGLDEKLKKW